MVITGLENQEGVKAYRVRFLGSPPKKKGEKKMWVMIIKRIPTYPTPPRMSLHWSVFWPNEKYAKQQEERKKEDSLNPLNPGHWGIEPDFGTARKIIFEGEQIRIFDYEFSAPSPENLHIYINESHELMAGSVAEEDFINNTLCGKKKILYQSARIMGCDHYQAMLTVMGVDIFDPKYEVPPIGWYKIRPEYGQYFPS